MASFRKLVVVILLASFLSSTSHADHGWMEKVVPVAGFIGGIGCAAYGYPMAGASLALSSAIGFGVSYIWRSCSRQKTPTLTEALNHPAEEVLFDSPDEMIRYFNRAFAMTSEFAVADAGSFRGNIAEDKEEVVLARAKHPIVMAAAVQARDRNLFLASSLLVEKEAENKGRIIQSIAQNLVTSKTGICTTFAGLAYYLLNRGGREHNIHVEIFARREGGKKTAQASTHLFAVIGRKLGSNVEDPTTWGQEARIVDLWLGALGNAYVYRVDDHEYQPWLKNLVVVQSNL